VPILIEDRPKGANQERNLWNFTYQTKMFDMADASHLFLPKAQLGAVNFIASCTKSDNPSHDTLGAYIPLYEAKMIHHFDHRWANYTDGATDDDESARDCTLAEKQDSNFEPIPRYWVPEAEVKLRAARVPSSVKRNFREKSAKRVLKSIAIWLNGYFAAIEGRSMREADLTRILGRGHAWRSILGSSPDRFLHAPKTLASGAKAQRETPLTMDDIAFLTDASDDPLPLAAALIDRKQPRWLIGWRDICRSTDDRTVIASVFPKVGAGHTIRVLYLDVSSRHAAAFIACISSLSLDYIGRQLIGSTHLTVETLKQLPIIATAPVVAHAVAAIAGTNTS
jgi:hypothetical protein